METMLPINAIMQKKSLFFTTWCQLPLLFLWHTTVTGSTVQNVSFPPPWQLLYNNGGEGGIAVKTNNLVGGMSDYFRYVSFVVQHFKHIFSDKQTKCRTQNNAGRATKENFIGSRLSLICRYILDHPIWDVTREEKTEGELWLWPEIQF